MKFLSSIILFLFMLPTAQSQNVIEDAGIQSLMNHYIQSNKSKTEASGYRVQLLVTRDRRQMEEAKRKFEMLYPGRKADWTFLDPYYKLKAGAFLNKLSAWPFFRSIQKEFPSSLLSPDRIEIQEALNY